MWIIIDCTHGAHMVEIIRDVDQNPVLFQTIDDAEIYAEEIDVGIPQFVELIV